MIANPQRVIGIDLAVNESIDNNIVLSSSDSLTDQAAQVSICMQISNRSRSSGQGKPGLHPWRGQGFWNLLCRWRLGWGQRRLCRHACCIHFIHLRTGADLVANTELMIKQSVWPSIISAQIAANFIAEFVFL